MDADLDAALAARELFDARDSANRFAILYRVQQAKTLVKRAAKIAEMLAMLCRGDTIHPKKTKRSRQRRGTRPTDEQGRKRANSG